MNISEAQEILHMKFIKKNHLLYVDAICTLEEHFEECLLIDTSAMIEY